LRTATRTDGALRQLASAHGIALSYTALGGRRVRTSTGAIVATLEALGVAVSSEHSIDSQLAAVRRERCDRPLEPVVVMRHTGVLSSAVTLPAAADPAACNLVVIREDGEVMRERLSDVVDSEAAGDGATRSLTLSLARLGLAAGYHEIAIEGPGIAANAMLLVAPRPTPSTSRSYGVFAPIYGLRGRSDWGVGTFTELADLADHVGALGASVVGTLPMFPIFFTPPVDPSPYLPVSRLFVNELFIDVEALPEFAGSDAARVLAGSSEVRDDLATLSQAPSVDYGEVMAHKRRVLEACADELHASPTTRRYEEFEAFLIGHPELASYADFRAAGERLGTRWHDWPSEPGRLPEGAVVPAAQRYHRYVQFAAGEQLAAAAAGDGGRAGLYLDLPVGVHPDGFDTWSRATLFAPATVGAPPDRLAPEGQAWGFPPLHPQRIRHERYRYVISCVRNLLAHARVIRIDHVLGLQRVFWIPAGAGADSGAYVQYPREELMAIVALEASRANVVVVGEDLGTVPAGIRQAMDRDAMLHSFVYQFAASANDPLPQPRSPSMASLGSHDLPRFAAFWCGADIDDRVARGVTTKPVAAAERVERTRLVDAVAGPLADTSTQAAFTACVRSLAAGPAPYVMVDLADLEGETEPDNRPGTGPEAGNWRRRLPRPLEAIVADDRVTAALAAIATERAEPQGVSA
jgi:4-alpha-glucanotransferase